MLEHPKILKLTSRALDFALKTSTQLDAPPKRTEKPTIVGALFRKHAKRVQRFMRGRLRNTEDGEEASQEVFLKLWRRESQGGLREDAKSYMYAATRTSVVDLERQRISRGWNLDEQADLDELAADQPDQEDALHWRRAMEHLVVVVRSFPEQTKRAFLLFYFNGMNYDEIAAELGVSRRTVERHVARAILHCRKRMRDYL